MHQNQFCLREHSQAENEVFTEKEHQLALSCFKHLVFPESDEPESSGDKAPSVKAAGTMRSKAPRGQTTVNNAPTGPLGELPTEPWRATAENTSPPSLRNPCSHSQQNPLQNSHRLEWPRRDPNKMSSVINAYK